MWAKCYEYRYHSIIFLYFCGSCVCDSVYTIFEHRILIAKQTFKDPRNRRSSISKEKTAAQSKYDTVIKHEVLGIKHAKVFYKQIYDHRYENFEE